MRSVEVAAAPQIVRPIMDGVAKLCGFVTGNAALATLLVLLGAVFALSLLAMTGSTMQAFIYAQF